MKRIKPITQIVVSAALIVWFSAIGGNIAAKDCDDPPTIIVFGFYFLRFLFRQLKTLLSGQ